MGGTWYRFRAEIRHGGWRFLVFVALLLGIGGGVALSALAGARRTASAFERLDAATLASDVLVNPDDGAVLDELPDDVVAQLPGVEQWARVWGVGITAPDGHFVETVMLTAADRRYAHVIERPAMREGRLFDPERVDEIIANPLGAELLGLDVGDRLELVVLTEDDATEETLSMSEAEIAEHIAAGEIGTPMTFTLVGIGITTSDVVPGGVLPVIVSTPAFFETVRPFRFFGGLGVRLEDRADGVPEFVAALRRSVQPGVGIDFQTTAGDHATIQRAVRPQAIALLAFGVVTAVGVIGITAQAFSRRAKASLGHDAALAGLGMSVVARRRLDELRIGAAVVIAPVVAVAVAIGLSGLFPVGLGRDVEPDPGVRVDAPVVVGGAIALVALAAAVSDASVRAARRDRGRRLAITARAAGAVTEPLGPVVATGVRFALESGDRRNTTPAKSTLVSAALGVTVIIASITFAASLDRFVTTPRSYGWDFDALVTTGDIGENDEALAEQVFADTVDRFPTLTGWAPAFLQQAPVGDGVIPIMGVGAGGGEPVHPTVVRGRLPESYEEVALGAVTMREEDVDIGDTIAAGVDGAPFEIVGAVVLPGLADYQGSDQAALGVGALFTLEGFQVATSLGFQSELGANAMLVALDGDAAGVERFQAELDAVHGEEYFIVEETTQPSDVIGYARIRSTPVVLAMILAVLAAITVGHGLIVSVRQRRRDFAVFRSLGFTRRQVSGVVASQATTVAVLAAVIGVPVGVVVGRLSWGAVARRLGIVNDPTTPLWAIVLALPAVFVLANVAAAIPAVVGGRLRPARELRAE